MPVTKQPAKLTSVVSVFSSHPQHRESHHSGETLSSIYIIGQRTKYVCCCPQIRSSNLRYVGTSKETEDTNIRKCMVSYKTHTHTHTRTYIYTYTSATVPNKRHKTKNSQDGKGVQRISAPLRGKALTVTHESPLAD